MFGGGGGGVSRFRHSTETQTKNNLDSIPLQWLKQLKGLPKPKIGKTRQSPRVKPVKICYEESSDDTLKKKVKSPPRKEP